AGMLHMHLQTTIGRNTLANRASLVKRERDGVFGRSRRGGRSLNLLKPEKAQRRRGPPFRASPFFDSEVESFGFPLLRKIGNMRAAARPPQKKILQRAGVT